MTSKSLKTSPTPDDEFERLLFVLNTEVSCGRMHLEIARKISTVAAERPHLLQCAQVFFVLTFRAHLESAYLRAARLFDSKSGTAAIASIPQAAEMHAGTFQYATPPEVRAQIKVWEGQIASARHLVDRLRELRNALIAHLDRNVILDPQEMNRTVAVTFTEIDGLLDTAKKIVRDALAAYNNAIYVEDLLPNDVDSFFRVFELAAIESKQ
jgi:hypothetical protein